METPVPLGPKNGKYCLNDWALFIPTLFCAVEENISLWLSFKIVGL